MKLLRYTNFITEKFNLVDNYTFDKSKLENLIKNARKWKLEDFIEEYINQNNISIFPTNYHIQKIKKGDEIILCRRIYNEDGSRDYDNYAYYKTVIADKDYNDRHWEFILDNTKELREEAEKVYNLNKNNKKEKFKKSDKYIIGYHASSKKFEYFKYGMHNQSGQLGADLGFFFFKDIKNAKYYASIIKENEGEAYIYKCKLRYTNLITEKGENVGTNWGRYGWLEQMDIEGYDMVIIEDADTGYGFTDEIVVFDDDNIKIEEVINYV